MTGAHEISYERRLLAAAGYLPAMFILVLAVQRDDGFCRHHACQSAALLVALAVAWAAIQLLELIVGRFLGGVFLVGFLFRALGWLIRNMGGLTVSAGYLVLMIMGIVHAGAGKRWLIPLLGPFTNWMKTCLPPKLQSM